MYKARVLTTGSNEYVTQSNNLFFERLEDFLGSFEIPSDDVYFCPTPWSDYTFEGLLDKENSLQSQGYYELSSF